MSKSKVKACALIVKKFEGENYSLLCFASLLEFKGNSRFRLGKYWVYPSIQGAVWDVDLNVFDIVGSCSGEQYSKLLEVWPGFSKDQRAAYSTLVPFPFSPSDNVSLPTKKFDLQVSTLRATSTKLVLAALSGHYVSYEAYAEATSKALLGMVASKSRLDLAIAIDARPSKRLASLGLNNQSGTEDAKALLLRQMVAVKTSQQKTLSRVKNTPEYATKYLTVMRQLGLQLAIVSSPLGEHSKFKIGGKNPLELYFVAGSAI